MNNETINKEEFRTGAANIVINHLPAANLSYPHEKYYVSKSLLSAVAARGITDMNKVARAGGKTEMERSATLHVVYEE